MARRPELISLLTLLILSFALNLACNDTPPERLEVEGYDQSCETANDCALVAEETCIECTGCAQDDAINIDALDDFQQAYRDVDCDELSPRFCNNACGMILPTCSNNHCAALVWSGRDEVADLLSDECASDQDCAAVASGQPDVCPSCCPDLAVNADSLRTTFGPSCPPDPQISQDCARECENGTRAVCDAGTCVLAP